MTVDSIHPLDQAIYILRPGLLTSSHPHVPIISPCPHIWTNVHTPGDCDPQSVQERDKIKAGVLNLLDVRHGTQWPSFHCSSYSGSDSDSDSGPDSRTLTVSLATLRMSNAMHVEYTYLSYRIWQPGLIMASCICKIMRSKIFHSLNSLRAEVFQKSYVSAFSTHVFLYDFHATLYLLHKSIIFVHKKKL